MNKQIHEKNKLKACNEKPFLNVYNCKIKNNFKG